MTMREILFRGKHSEKSRWDYGDLYIDHGKVYIGSSDIIHGVRVYGEVIPETVGQFTGLTDKTGRKIFEGDVVQMRTSGFSGHGEIVFKDGSFGVDDKKRKRFYYMYHDAVYRVDGNIHDNPELMEDK